MSRWPCTEASLVFQDRVGTYDSTMITRLRSAGIVPVGMTTASEFGGLNVTVTRLHGVTGNAWDVSRTAGGSSAGSATAVAGLLALCTGGDGGGWIRIPDAFNGLFGSKGGSRDSAANETMAGLFDQVDFVFASTNPDVAFPAEVTLNTRR